MKYNVQCRICGKKAYNPNISLDHVIDCCAASTCMTATNMTVIAYRDGDVSHKTKSNTYEVPLIMINNEVSTIAPLSMKMVEQNEIYANILYRILMKEYSHARLLINTASEQETARMKFAQGMIHYYTNDKVNAFIELAAAAPHEPNALIFMSLLIIVGKKAPIEVQDDAVRTLVSLKNKGNYAAAEALAKLFLLDPFLYANFINSSNL